MFSSRREFLQDAGAGAGWLALLAMAQSATGPSAPRLGQSAVLGAERPSHFAPRVKRVIWLFMHGGPSQVDLFDPKPDLERLSGAPLPAPGRLDLTGPGATLPHPAPATPT